MMRANPVHVRYCFTSAVSTDQVSTFTNMLDHDTAELLSRRTADDRASSVVAHALARMLVAEHVGCKPHAFSVERTCQRCGSAAHGKPTLVAPGGGRHHISIAHTAGLAVVAYGSGPLGVDVEALVAARNWTAIAQEFFSNGERDLLQGADTRLGYQLWVCKEAVMKMTGLGFSHTPWALNVSPVPCWVECEEGRCWVQPLTLPEGYVGALASQQRSPLLLTECVPTNRT